MPAAFTFSSRLNSFKARPELFGWQAGPAYVPDLIRRAGQVDGLGSIMLNYPEHFADQPAAEIRAASAEAGLTVSGINLRYPDPEFTLGSFTHPDPARRRAAVDLTVEAARAGREMAADHVIMWLGPDGSDYPFQMNYLQAFDWEVACIGEVVEALPDMRFSIEYKPTDPRRYSLLGNVGSTLLAVKEVGAANLGVTLDFCHQLMANENPALAAAMCLRSEKLFGLHLNDGYRTQDDGLMVGSVNLAQTLELLYYLMRHRYADVLYFDTFPVREDPVEECRHNIERINRMVQVVEAMDPGQLEAMQACQDGLWASRMLWKALFP